MEPDMSHSEAPLHRSIGLSGGLRFLLAVVAVATLVGAFATGLLILGIVGAVFLIAAVVLGYQARRARLAADADLTSRRQ
jgi:hypothetical protein